MKWKIIVEKMVKNKMERKKAIIDIKTNPQAIISRMKYYGWDVAYLEPVIKKDKNTVLIETGRKV